VIRVAGQVRLPSEVGASIAASRIFEKITAHRSIPMSQPDEPRKVIVVDLQMPFLSIVTLMVKWVLASIPAIIILAMIFSLVMTLMGGLIKPMMHWLP
jgi:hypothetical protein